VRTNHEREAPGKMKHQHKNYGKASQAIQSAAAGHEKPLTSHEWSS
jgi:hypothetical protein